MSVKVIVIPDKGGIRFKLLNVIYDFDELKKEFRHSSPLLFFFLKVVLWFLFLIIIYITVYFAIV